jgi:predicted AAA+ superfamily ATPase
MRLTFDSIPAHLGRENHKFIFGHIAKGARARDFETAVQSIVDSGLAARVYRVAKVAKPLKFYRDLSAFKLYLHDVGLLGCALETDPGDVLLSNKAFEEYKGAMTEQYVCQQLIASGNVPYYWSTQKSTAELDFIIQKGKEPAPLEAKAEENLRSRSLRILCEKTGLHGYRTSMSDYREQGWITNIPLWAIGPYFSLGDK